jgi:hypothetical protein
VLHEPAHLPPLASQMRSAVSNWTDWGAAPAHGQAGFWGPYSAQEDPKIP